MPLAGISTGAPPSVTGSFSQEPSRDGGCGCSPAEVCRLYFADPPSSCRSFLSPVLSDFGIGLRASQKAFGPSAFHAVSNRQVSSRTFRPVMLAGLTGQPGLHSLAATHRSWSSLVDSAALTASLSRFSPGQMKCLPDFRLAASIYSLRCNDNHPVLRHRSRL